MPRSTSRRRMRSRSPSQPRRSPFPSDAGTSATAVYGQDRPPHRDERARRGRPRGDGPGAGDAMRRGRAPRVQVTRERTTTSSHYSFDSRHRSRSRSRDGRTPDAAAHDAGDPPHMSGANGGASPRAPTPAAGWRHVPADELTLGPESSRAQTEPEFLDRLRQRNQARGQRPDDDGWREQAQRCRPGDGGPAKRDDPVYVVKTALVKK